MLIILAASSPYVTANAGTPSMTLMAASPGNAGSVDPGPGDDRPAVGPLSRRIRECASDDSPLLFVGSSRPAHGAGARWNGAATVTKIVNRVTLF
jgi:hypothetical protein